MWGDMGRYGEIWGKGREVRASGGNVSMSEARRSGEKTKALPTSLPRPRVVKMGCPDGHRPLPPSSPNTAASACSHPGRPLVISDDPISAARWRLSSAAHLGHLG